MRSFFPILLVSVLACGQIGAQEDSAPADAETSTAAEQDKILYALGVAMAQGLQQLDLEEADVTKVEKGLRDALFAEPEVSLEEYGPKIQQMFQEAVAKSAEKRRVEGLAYVDKMAAMDGAVKAESGLVYIEKVAGTGEQPTVDNVVSVHYHGTLTDGTVFDSSVDRGSPASFGLGQVIPCWTEGVQKMRVGGKATLVCPPDIAYGERAAGQIPPGSTLLFEVELLEIVQPPEEAPVPEATSDEG